MELLILCFAAFLAGFVDSVAGGGGLIQTPALFLFLPAPLAAVVATVFGTNKMISICGTSVAAFQYARHCPIRWKTVLPCAIAAFLFSFLGARAVSSFDSATLKPVILVLLVSVAIFTYWHRDFGKTARPPLATRAELPVSILIGVVLGFYDGFFGPGTGTFLMFAFIGLFGFDFLAASASAKFVNLATNLAAVLWFGSHGNILYHYAVPMAVCNVGGAALGSRLAILRGNQFVRLLFLVIVGGMIVRIGFEFFGGH